MKTIIIQTDDAKMKCSEYDFVLAYENSEMIFGRIGEVRMPDFDQIQEGYFFSPESQMHVFRECNQLKAVIIEDDENDVYEIRRYALNTSDERTQKVGEELIVKEYLDQDEDGQAFIRCTRMVDVE